MTTVVIVEPKPLIRLGIEHYLTRVFPEFKIRSCEGLASNNETLFPYCCDLVLLAVNRTACIQSVIKEVQKQYVCPKLVVLSDARIMPAEWVDLPSAVIGYVGYESPLQILTRTIAEALGKDGGWRNEIKRNGAKVDIQAPTRRSTALDTYLLQTATSVSAEQIEVCSKQAKYETRHLRLTPRQYQVLVYLAHGWTNLDISKALGVSLSTVRKHTQGIYMRLEVGNRNEAVYKALKSGAGLGLSVTSARVF